MNILAETLITNLSAKGIKIVLAESCTAGLAADYLAAVPGASASLWGSFVTYTLDAKEKMLGIESALLATFGAVSSETACAMAAGALQKSGADIALSVTGLAGPSGDGSENPVGTVWIGSCKVGEQPRASRYHFSGNRAEIRKAAALAALSVGLDLLQ